MYPALSGAFFLAVIIVFIYSARFLSGAFQKAFDFDAGRVESQLARLDLENFYPVAKKLGIEPATDSQQPTTDNLQQEVGNEPAEATNGAAISEEAGVATGTAATISTETATSSAVASAPAVASVPPPDKSLVKISVLNGTKTAGLAADLKNFLTTEGWTVANAGNASAATETIIKIKESKKDYSPLIRASVSKKYALGADQTLSESDIYDIIVIIGR